MNPTFCLDSLAVFHIDTIFIHLNHLTLSLIDNLLVSRLDHKQHISWLKYFCGKISLLRSFRNPFQSIFFDSHVPFLKEKVLGQIAVMLLIVKRLRSSVCYMVPMFVLHTQLG